MCKPQNPKVKMAAHRTNSITNGMASEGKSCDSMSYGLDRSCPASVTTPPGQGVRLDQYQSCIRSKRIRQGRQKVPTGCQNAEKVAQFNLGFPDSSAFKDHTCVQDHEFEWYDLDAIRDVNYIDSNSDSTIIIGHDSKAGLVFTTKGQVLSKGVEVNTINPLVRIDNNTNKQEFEFDLFFWINNDHNEIVETSEDREFRERMQALEQEMNCDESSIPFPSLHFPLSLSLSDSSSEDSEAENDNERDGSGSLFANWLFEDAKA